MYYKKYIKYKRKYLQLGSGNGIEKLTVIRFPKSEPDILDRLKNKEKTVKDMHLPINFQTLFPQSVKWFKSDANLKDIV